MDSVLDFLATYGASQQTLNLVEKSSGIMLIIIIALIAHYVAKYPITSLIEKAVMKSRNKYDDLLQQEHVFTKATAILPSIAIIFSAPFILDQDHAATHLLIIAAKCTISFQVAKTISALLNVINKQYDAIAQERYIPLNPIIQIMKLTVYLVAVILSISYIIDRSPMYLLSGLGAIAAALMLVFQDTIKGFAASMQISANKMVTVGDWVELPKYGADGDVLEIGLTTVKIQNFDKTIVTVPTYALTSGSFKNWHGMKVSGGRRIKRTINVDTNSIYFYQLDDLEKLKHLTILAPYIEEKLNELTADATKKNIATNDINARQLTNIGTFRAYISLYLKQHAQVNHAMTCMVRQLPVDAKGLPLELYFFSKDKRWISYEGIQADIFDHLYAIAPIFNLRIFQLPSGYDWHKNNH
ncbi:small conductance mechanosensitive ion channel protein YbdG [Thalassotalea loyana]|uniref:Small conductance mechanosensitive ion channel protein YbdG n=1 Tax=Thalassotalea loyana TaxID=280483 RepID=A0ABQ6HDK2_9GAMM|nr:mechanosensitive ion channel domain-containing protein [Thalassotalea loyana]GLX86190.1 small conductance mechanosensitive ion channel protein YbdG [Thalassotalea loyana]